MDKKELDISKETYSSFIKLAGYQIIGGSLGIAILIWGLSKTTELTLGTVLIYLFMSLFFIFSVFCGIRCIQAKASALKLSLVNQCIQLVGFSVLGFAFTYIAGLYLTATFDFTELFNFNFGFGISNFDFKFNSDSETVAVSINIVALLFIIWIRKLMKKVNAELAIIKTNEIGTDLVPQSIEN